MEHTTCTLHFQHFVESIRTSLSAVRQIGPHLWLGCDETATLERLTYRGTSADKHQHFQVADFLELPNPADEEIDIEGIAYTDHYLWFVGSHSLKRKSYKSERSLAENLERLQTIEREDNRYTLGRIPLVKGQLHQTCSHPQNAKIQLTAAQLKRKKKGNELTHYLHEDPYLGDFFTAKIPGKDNGFDIEGIAVVGDRIFLGLRGPVLRGWSVLIELEVKEDEPGLLKLKKIGPDKQRYILHFLDLQGLGIRDLCPQQDHLLILAGPTMALNGPVQLFSIPLAELKQGQGMQHPKIVSEVPHGQNGDRPEGMTLLNAELPELLVVYDAPTHQRLHGSDAVIADRFTLPIHSDTSILQA